MKLTMLTWILALKVVVEVAALAVLGRSLLGLLVGARRDNNLAYQVLSAVALPALRLARLLSPRIVIDRHLPLVALLLLGFTWIVVTGWKISHCRAIGVAACL
jgi:uncharacterized protein YggT (Ycf19 family)